MWYDAKLHGQERSEEEKQEIDLTRISKGLNPIFHKREFYLPGTVLFSY